MTLPGRRSFPIATIPIVLSALVQYRVTRNCFVDDDFLNLYGIRNYALYQFLIEPSAGHLLLARNAVFFLSWTLFGMNPTPYLWIAFLTHLLNVWLLFRTIDGFTGSRIVAAFGAALWGVSPMHVAPLGYYSNYGDVMVGTAALAVLAQVATAGTHPSTGATYRWYALAILGALSWGAGISFALTLPFALAVLLPEWRPRWRLPLVGLLIVVPILYFGLLKVYEITSGQSLPTLGWRFGMWLVGLRMGAPLGFVRLLAFSLLRLLLPSLPAPWVFPAAYVVLAAFCSALAVVLWNAPAAARRRVGACALLVLSAYGVITMTRLGRVLAIPADMMDTDGRYHYVPLIPVTILLCLALQPMASRWPRLSLLLFASWCVLIASSARFTAPDADRCARSDRDIARALTTIRATVASTPRGATAYIPNGAFPPMPMRIIFPGWAALFTLYYDGDVVDGRRVRFLETNPAVLEFAREGRRSRDLLVAHP